MTDLTQDWHALDAEKALNILESDGDAGLTAEEAKKRLDVYGANELQEKPPPRWTGVIIGGNDTHYLTSVILLVSIQSPAERR